MSARTGQRGDPIEWVVSFYLQGTSEEC